jgi:hypothetical protein
LATELQPALILSLNLSLETLQIQPGEDHSAINDGTEISSTRLLKVPPVLASPKMTPKIRQDPITVPPELSPEHYMAPILPRKQDRN